jgi:hypothetical protein
MGVEFDKQKSKKRAVDGVDEPVAQAGAVSLPQVSSPTKQGPITIEVEEIPLFVTGIVFCRDVKVLARMDESNRGMSTPGYYNLRQLVQHENMLDIKQLIKTTTMASEIEKNENMRGVKAKKVKAGGTKAGADTDTLIAKLDETLAGQRTLLFESRFESGNLYLAQKVSDNEYNLLMQNDINTQGHTQWFYFRVQNTRKGHSVKLNIINYVSASPCLMCVVASRSLTACLTTG